MSDQPGERPGRASPIDILERGGRTDGVPETLDHRLFVRLQVFAVKSGLAHPVAHELGGDLRRARCAHTIYADAHHPRGIGLLTWSTDANHFIDTVRPVVGRLDALEIRPEYTMLGRTYAIGYEKNLPYALVERAQVNVTKPDWPWAVWYPLRRKGGFNLLDRAERMDMLREHGAIGRAFGEAGLATDVRLACHGLDPHDNDFVIGLIGKTLDPLSKVVEAMRSTRQTAEWMDSLGPFFVGRAIAQHRP